MEEGSNSGTIAGLSVRPGRREPVELRDELNLRADSGPEGDHADRARRGLTLISEELWKRAASACGTPDLPWHTRRANVLLSGLELDATEGRRLRLGDCVLEITGECDPCGLMDEYQPGLKEALMPELRAGLMARIVEGGVVRIGDRVSWE